MTLRHLTFSIGEVARTLLQFAYLATVIVIVTGVLLWLVLSARAHDSWINRGGFKNGAGEWCCGDFDCKAYQTAQSTPRGWLLDGELVPYDEAMPIAPPDAQVTVCRRPDGSRRCVFGLKPGF